MSNPYDDFKKKQGLVKYLCNQCRFELKAFDIDTKATAASVVDSVFGKAGGVKPSAFYCVNNKCVHFGLVTKVAVVR